MKTKEKEKIVQRYVMHLITKDVLLFFLFYDPGDVCYDFPSK